MKLRCLAGLMAVIIMAGTAVAAEIYNKDRSALSMFGNFVEGYYVSKNVNRHGDHSFVRYGLFGKTYISDRVVGFGTWEHEISLKNVEGGFTSSGNQVSLGYVGVEFGDLGSIDYGRNYGVLYDVGSWTDVIPAFGGELYLVDNFLSNRSSNLLTYRNRNFFGFIDGFNFAIQYQGENNCNLKTGRTVKTENGDGYGVSASYTLRNGIAASAAYTNSRRTVGQRNLDDLCDNDIAEAYSFGMKYDGNGVYLAAVYGETFHMSPFGDFGDNTRKPDGIYGFSNKTSNVELVAQYQFDFGLRPSISYLHSRSDDFGDERGNDYLKKFITIGASYIFNKNFSTTIDYRINLLDKNNFVKSVKVATDDIFSCGVVYSF